MAISRVSSCLRRGAVRERGEELAEHVVVGPVALVLAAVVVRAQPAAAGQARCRSRSPAAHPAARRASAASAMRCSRNAVFPSPALPVMMTSRYAPSSTSGIRCSSSAVGDVGAVRVRTRGCPRC